MSEEKKQGFNSWLTRHVEMEKILSGDFEAVDDPKCHEYLIDVLGHGTGSDQYLRDILELEDATERRKNIAEYLVVDICQNQPANNTEYDLLEALDKDPAYRPAVGGAIYSCNSQAKLENPRWLHIVTQDLVQYQFLLNDDFVEALKSVIEYYEEDSQNSQTV